MVLGSLSMGSGHLFPERYKVYLLAGKCTFSSEALYFVYLMMFSYSLSLPLLSLNLLYITLASTLAGLQRDNVK